jgi:hypothetical protein
VDHGKVSRSIALGTHQQLPISVDMPDTSESVYLELEVSKPGQGVLYRDASTVYEVTQAD